MNASKDVMSEQKKNHPRLMKCVKLSQHVLMSIIYTFWCMVLFVHNRLFLYFFYLANNLGGSNCRFCDCGYCVDGNYDG